MTKSRYSFWEGWPLRTKVGRAPLSALTPYSTERFNTLLSDYFGVKSLPDEFELHSHHLLSPEGEGEFLGHDRERRNELALELLDLIADRQHQIHYIAVEKACIHDNATAKTSPIFNAREPYLIGFNYLTTYLELFVRNHLGSTARGMVILDVKEQYQDDIESITHFRRFEVAASRRLKWLVEFTYPVDSARHPMIQLADLVIFCTRKFFEMDRGHRRADVLRQMLRQDIQQGMEKNPCGRRRAGGTWC